MRLIVSSLYTCQTLPGDVQPQEWRGTGSIIPFYRQSSWGCLRCEILCPVSRSPFVGRQQSHLAPPPTRSLHSQTSCLFWKTTYRQEGPREDPPQVFIDASEVCRLETKGNEERIFRVLKNWDGRKESVGDSGAVMTRFIKVRKRESLGGQSGG